ncbi:MAG: hypothetical protein Q8J65_03330 [Nitrosomonadales bacterium]|nr:hypothetical protein [Nitrosomonadales bacterium]
MLRQLLLILAIIGFSGCATYDAPNYSPNYETIDQVKKIRADRFSVATVQPTDPEAKVNKISLRGASLKSQSGTFSKYLENALISDLTELGFYDASSDARIHVNILKNEIDVSGLSKGTGILAANVKVIKGGTVSLDKDYTASTQFESSFAGAVAIPKGQTEYPNLVRAFLSHVYSDQSFVEAIKK